MEEYTSWCDEEANEKEDAITSSKRTIGDLEATIEDAEASIQSLTASIDELTSKISSSETELAEASGIREKEHAVFVASEKALVETVDSLERQPQGKTVAYESSSGGILDTIADMQSKAEESLSGTRKDEMEAAHAYALVKQGLEDEIKVANKQLSEATLTRSTTEEELHSAEASLSETEEALAADTKYLEELKQSCTTKATEWAARQKQASEETAAIQKAKDILSEGVKVFLQTSSHTRLQSETEASLDARSQVVSILKKLARTENSYALAQLASQARSDPFGKIRGLIEEMIAKLTDEAAEEADQKSFCDEETSESKAKQADLSGKLDKVSARISKAESGKAKLLEEIKMLETEISEMDAGQAEATKVRQEEHEEYLKA